MALDGNSWGSAVATAVKAATAANVTPGTPITDGQLEVIWQAICTEHASKIHATAVVNVSGVTPGGGTALGTVS